jgi:hypothetical protein
MGGMFTPIRFCFRQAKTWRRHAEEQADSIDRGQIFDYGALSSVREEASGVALQHYFLGRDEIMFVLLAQERLIRAISKFLDKMNIDTAKLPLRSMSSSKRRITIRAFAWGEYQ